MLDVVAFGEAMLRLSTPAGETLDRAPGFDVHIAGSESNVAVALASLGRRVAWISALPADPLGERVAADLRSAGVDVDGVVWVENSRLGAFYVEAGVEPRPTRVVYDRARSAFASLSQAPPAPPARWAVTSGITAAVLRGAPDAVTGFAEAARAAGGRLCVDVNHRALLWSAAEARTGVSALLALADVVVCSTDDLVNLFGTEPDPAGIQRFRSDFAPDAELVVVTDGDRGATAFGAEGPPVHQAAPRARFIDRLGAGDAFVAGLLHGLLRDDLGLGLRYGVWLGAAAGSVRGDQVRMRSADLDRRVDHATASVLR